jgi:hypothetical protein
MCWGQQSERPRQQRTRAAQNRARPTPIVETSRVPSRIWVLHPLRNHLLEYCGGVTFTEIVSVLWRWRAVLVPATLSIFRGGLSVLLQVSFLSRSFG